MCAYAHPTSRIDEKANLPAGLWLESAATLTIQVQSKYPVLASAAVTGGSLAEGLFGRVVVVTRTEDVTTASIINDFIVACNLEALKINRRTKSARKDALAKYKLSPEERDGVDLDVLTGYQVFDRSARVFFVEGLEEKAIRRLLDVIPGLTAGLVNIRLSPDLKDALKKTSTYLRKRMPADCFECLTKLDQVEKLSCVKV
ncbi:hypothetical protein HK097_003118 [Rhizophlyctis rosea]|uniref:Uncharacterized protein n=1 Tax=Rhizophlyctis rosea TaxID=64517 RepID=A0AAD5SA39_9FUNG|nr:hypothetical protein HK097_003118 [Rhizophlyctis rosea]